MNPAEKKTKKRGSLFWKSKISHQTVVELYAAYKDEQNITIEELFCLQESLCFERSPFEIWTIRSVGMSFVFVFLFAFPAHLPIGIKQIQTGMAGLNLFFKIPYDFNNW